MEMPGDGNFGGFDAFIVGLAPDLATLSFGTYLGGSDNDVGVDIAVGQDGSIYIVGSTMSPDFPTTPNATQSEFGGVADGFLLKFDASGSLKFSSFLGGSAADGLLGVAIGPTNEIIVTGYSGSDDLHIPRIDGPVRGSADALIVGLDSESMAPSFGLLLGGSGGDSGQSVIVDSDGQAYVTGLTDSRDFPVVNAWQSAYQGGRLDSFVAKISADGSDVIYSTYLGGVAEDRPSRARMALGADQTLYVSGGTTSSNFPATEGSYQRQHSQSRFNVYIARLDVGGRLLASTLLGGGDQAFGEIGSALVVDVNGDVGVVGSTSSPDFPITKFATQSFHAGSDDVFFALLSGDLSRLIYSTFLGGISNDNAWGMVLSDAGQFLIGGVTSSSDFPADSDNVLQGQADAFLTCVVPVTCPGDCGSDQSVSVDELLLLIRIALGDESAETCISGDTDHSGAITIDEIVTAVSAALTGCE